MRRVYRAAELEDASGAAGSKNDEIDMLDVASRMFLLALSGSDTRSEETNTKDTAHAEERAEGPLILQALQTTVSCIE